MFRDLFPAVVIVALAAQASTPAPQPPAANASPTNGSSASPRDPAAVVFDTAAGMVLHPVKAANTEAYEAAIVALKEALTSSEEPETQQLTRAWRVYKAAEPDAKGSVIYVHWIDPVLAGVDYRASLWLDKLLAGAPAELLERYRDAFAAPPTKLSLTEIVPPKKPQQ